MLDRDYIQPASGESKTEKEWIAEIISEKYHEMSDEYTDERTSPEEYFYDQVKNNNLILVQV